MKRDEMLHGLYVDYVGWCHIQGVPPSCWEDFFNTLKGYDDSTLDHIGRNYRGEDRMTPAEELQHWNRILEMMGNQVMSDIISLKPVRSHPSSETIRGAKMDFQPIQPNDEERAVAEVMRMLGGGK